MAEEHDKYSTIHYHRYLQLEKILNAQTLRSAEVEGKAAHEEMLFIIIHQAYELWFKQIIHEIGSVKHMFESDQIDERNIGRAVNRLERVDEILQLLIQQIRVLETMTPLDFLDFRSYLFPASGFQSYQFRMVEVMLGLREAARMTYNGHPYRDSLLPEQRGALEDIERGGSLFDLVEKWLERTPFLEFHNFNFLEQYKKAVENMLAKEAESIRESAYLTDEQKSMRLNMLGGTDTYFHSILDPTVHANMLKEGKLRLSYKATLGALLIKLYRDEPILHLPYQMLNKLTDIDELLVTWRYRHAQMVLRMLGRKIGTGGSSGYEYLRETANKHQIFGDLHNISTMLIPRSELPELPARLKLELGFYFSQQHEKDQNT